MTGTPPAAGEVFGDRLPLAERYAALLAGDGITRGLLGPREATRVWDRHLLNCAVVTDLVPDGALVVDVGSGAGLPGVPMAIRRPDLKVVLVEPLLRRATFLTDLVDELQLGDQLEVVRGRAESAELRRDLAPLDWIVARAVAPLARLVRWTLPLLRPGGALLAMKGVGAAGELAEARAELKECGARDARLVNAGADVVGEPVRVIRVMRGEQPRERWRRG